MNGKALLEKRVAETSCAQVARELSALEGDSISRSTISLVVRGIYDANPEPVYARAERAYGRLDCPFLLERITYADCAWYSGRQQPEMPMQTQDADATEIEAARKTIRHWRACQSCDHKRQ